MKIIIAGGRDYNLTPIHAYKILSILHDTKCKEVVSGCADGADKVGEGLAVCQNITVKRFPAEWNKNCAAAGPIRNE